MSRDIAAMNRGVLALVLIVICFHIENTNSREIITRKFDDMCEIKFYGVQNFIVEHDKFDKTTAKRRRKTDRSLETLGKRYRFCFKIIDLPIRIPKIRFCQIVSFWEKLSKNYQAMRMHSKSRQHCFVIGQKF